MDNEKLHPLLLNMIPLVEGISRTLGSNCEVVLHDIKTPQHSVIAISNGHVTGRSVGSPMTERGLKAIRNKEYEKNLIKYKTITKDGRTLKSSTLFIKDQSDEVVGCLCINVDISEFVVAKNVITELTETIDDSNKNKEIQETYSNNINDILYSVVERVLENIGKPVAYLNKEEKVKIVENLDEKGTFLIKGSVEYVAEVLCVSRYTIYNYLDKIRARK
ncbi:PAS domain-containing protein [Clostridium sp. D2Q-14]|uniref:helix-turn-helix transcriptional regulator n=1 Tax=Anaeromonas gelatinilytica TaxID=2683194 RepID=UPI00193BACFA|nr:PAS domain-containing protein [Anaeromonas gelatinilytica]MBS4535849.1 PAS domain-containing protein [Anaeromonas gelatinilytica]